MEVTREQVKDFLKSMSLMDAATLVKELEAELGVSAAAPVAVAAAGGAPAGAAAAAAPEKEDFNVVLLGPETRRSR
jgi:large subunit ribosomal protein L7/L12